MAGVSVVAISTFTVGTLAGTARAAND
jgi:hypothetical protein